MVAVAAISFGQKGTPSTNASRYNSTWDSGHLITINGKVIAKKSAPPLPGVEPTTAIYLRQGKKKFEVQLGPGWFVDNVKGQFKVGDNVTAMGSQVNLNGRSVILAQTITKGRADTTYRAKNGDPFWIGMATSVAPAQNQGQNGTIMGTNIVNVDGSEYMTYEVNTGDKTVNIVAGPAWYARRAYNMRVGDNIQILGVTRTFQIAPYLYVADTAYSGGSTITFRPYGW